MEEEKLCEQLSAADQSIYFIVLIIAGIILSLKATVVQRDALCAQLCGETPDTSEVYPLRHTANSIIIGALGFFLCLAIKAWRETDPDDCVARRSAHSNLWASLLVLAAAIIRYDDVEFTRCAAKAASEG